MEGHCQGSAVFNNPVFEYDDNFVHEFVAMMETGNQADNIDDASSHASIEGLSLRANPTFVPTPP